LARKIIQLLDDPELRTKMGRFGRTRVENELEWKYEVPKLLAAYDTVFASQHEQRKDQ
jgi:glycosyltransferase involved in cell wall biosynthesis